MIISTIVGPYLGLFFIILVLFIIISIPLLILTYTTKFNTLKLRGFYYGIIVLVLLWFVEFIIYTIYERITYVPESVHRAQSDIKTISTSLELFHAENYSYPTTQEGLQALVNDPDPTKYKNWRQYIRKYPTDPWGNKYNYLNPGIHGEIDIYSFGIDGIQSKDDIGNWQFNN